MSRLPENEQWQVLDQALHTLLALDPAQRDARIAKYHGAQPGLAAELKRLLALAENPGPLERMQESSILVDAMDSLPDQPVSIADWKILERIGVGGMAEVFLAEREHEGVTQRAALKLMARGLASSELRARFQRERAILARLADSRIARYFDGGIADDGRPWLAMELVEGRTIKAYCDLHKLDLRQRLELFRQVCGAVAHAHRNLVIHRDIKPSNVLVSHEGQVKLIDFGIAKPISGEDTSETQTNARLLTPQNASPEQLRGEPGTTVTDVFLLGLLLYELVVGCRPFAEHDDDSFLLEQALRERDPPRPSDLLANRRRDHPDSGLHVDPSQLRGDLDRIILMALRKDPAARYSSVDLLDADIAAWLEGRPVVARGHALAYPLRKWISRHRLAAAALLGALVLAMGYTLVLIHQNRLVAEQRDLARHSASQAAAVRDFLLEMFSEADPSKSLGEKLSVGTVLERGSARIANETTLDPHVRAEMLHTIGLAYHALGNHARARSLVGEAIVLRRQWPDSRVDLSRSLSELSSIERDDSHLEESIALAREAHELAGDDLRARATALNALGVSLLMHDQQLDGARHALDQALDAYRAWPEPDPVRIAVAQGNRAAIDLSEGKLVEAEQGLTTAVGVLSPRLGDTHPEVTALLYNLARLQERQGKYVEAELHFRRVLAAETAVLGAEHPDVAIDRTRLAYVLAQRGDSVQAEQEFSSAMKVMRAKLPADHKRIAENLMGHAETLLDLDRATDAEARIDEAIAILLKHFKPDDWRVAEARRIQARTWLRLGRPEAAIAQLEQIGPVLLGQPAPVPERYQASLREAQGSTSKPLPN